MEPLRAEILEHLSLRVVRCCLCGSEWEEQLIAVALCTGQSPLGELCPRCLRMRPAEAAARLRVLRVELRGLSVGGGQPPGADAEGLGGRIAGLRAETDAVVSLLRRVWALSAVLQASWAEAHRDPWAALRGDEGQQPAVPEGPPGAAGLADDLLRLADQLAGLPGWGVTVERAVEAERRCFLERYKLEGDDARRVVDDRYRDFLAATA